MPSEAMPFLINCDSSEVGFRYRIWLSMNLLLLRSRVEWRELWSEGFSLILWVDSFSRKC